MESDIAIKLRGMSSKPVVLMFMKGVVNILIGSSIEEILDAF